MKKEEWLISLLTEVYHSEKDQNNKPYSYASLADEINAHTQTWLLEEYHDEANLVRNNISSYLSERKTRTKKSLPSGYRLLAIERFIFDCTIIGKSTKTQSSQTSLDVPVPAAVLFNYLTDKGSSAKINSGQIEGLFEWDDSDIKLQIEFSNTGSDYISIVSVKVFQKDNTLGFDKKPDTYFGWAVVSPENYIWVFSKNIDIPLNQYFHILEVNNDAYQLKHDLEQIYSFLAVRSDIPFYQLSNNLDIGQFKTLIANERICYFNRLQNLIDIS